MKYNIKIFFTLISCAVFFVSYHVYADPFLNPNNARLSSKYVNNAPVIDYYQGSPGCYLMCYNKDDGVFKVGKFGIHGFLRVDGHYKTKKPDATTTHSRCYPKDFESNDTREVPELVKLCNLLFPSCLNSCLPGQHTGAYFHTLKQTKKDEKYKFWFGENYEKAIEKRDKDRIR